MLDQIQRICWKNSGRVYVRTLEHFPVNLRMNFQEIAGGTPEEFLEEINSWRNSKGTPDEYPKKNSGEILDWSITRKNSGGFHEKTLIKFLGKQWRKSEGYREFLRNFQRYFRRKPEEFPNKFHEELLRNTWRV